MYVFFWCKYKEIVYLISTCLLFMAVFFVFIFLMPCWCSLLFLLEM